MDYSLLVGIHDCVRAEEEALQGDSALATGRSENSESEECDSGERYIDYHIFDIYTYI